MNSSEPKIDLYFPVSIYKVENLLEKSTIDSMRIEVDRIEKTVPRGGSNWQSDVYNTLGTHDISSNIIFKDLCEKVNWHVNNYNYILGSNHSITKSTDSWLNIYYKDQYQELHHHPDQYSAVFFLTAPENCSNFMIVNPNEHFQRNLVDIREFNKLNEVTNEIKVEENLLIIFRSFVKHMVPKNKSLNKRVSISFNF
jgi:uncharacterized protein (TIGR02466 family)